MLKSKDLLGLQYLSAEEIGEILDGAVETKKFLKGDRKSSDVLKAQTK